MIFSYYPMKAIKIKVSLKNTFNKQLLIHFMVIIIHKLYIKLRVYW